MPHKKAKSGAYVVNYYDEEGYAALRKVSELTFISNWGTFLSHLTYAKPTAIQYILQNYVKCKDT